MFLFVEFEDCRGSLLEVVGYCGSPDVSLD